MAEIMRLPTARPAVELGAGVAIGARDPIGARRQLTVERGEQGPRDATGTTRQARAGLVTCQRVALLSIGSGDRATHLGSPLKHLGGGADHRRAGRCEPRAKSS